MFIFRKMLRYQNELSREECIDLLKTEKRGVMSVIGDGGYPYGFPINHYYCEADGKLYFHGARIGHHIDAIQANPKVSFCVYGQDKKEPGDWAYYVKSVIIFGQAALIEDPQRIAEICTALCEKFPCPEDYCQQEIEEDGKYTLCFEIRIEDMKGKLVHEA